MTKQTTIVVIGSLRVKACVGVKVIIGTSEHSHCMELSYVFSSLLLSQSLKGQISGLR